MQTLNKLRQVFLIALIPFLLMVSCKKEYEYGVVDTQTIPASATKDKLKTTEQYLSILHANLFQKALSANELVELSQLVLSCGDKETIHEIIISNFMNTGEVILPSDTFMRNNPDAFLVETYERFFVRQPSELEKEFFTSYLELHPEVTTELVYFAFALSDEYQYY